jgi:RND family efflux transporter MFP subunit
MRRLVLREIGFAVALGLAAAGGALAQTAAPAPTSGSEGGEKPSGPAVTAVRAKRMTFVDNLWVTGSLVPREEILVGPEIDGYRITELLVDEGDVVKPGQALARLAKETLNAQLLQNTASIARAQAAIEQAESTIVESRATLQQARDAFERIKPLRQSGVASQAAYDEREAAFRVAQARVTALQHALAVARADKQVIEAQRRELELRLGFTEITAPAGGLVTRRSARVGAVSSSQSEALFRIIRDSEVEMSAEIPEFEIVKLERGQRAQVTVPGVGERAGVVRLVSPEVNEMTRLGRVRISLGPDPGLRIGMFARASVRAGQREALGVPSTAVLYGSETTTLLVVDRDNTVRQREVRTGLVSGDYIEIASGIGEGDLVIRRAGSLLRDGEKVTPVIAEQAVSEVRP